MREAPKCIARFQKVLLPNYTQNITKSSQIQQKHVAKNSLKQANTSLKNKEVHYNLFTTTVCWFLARNKSLQNKAMHSKNYSLTQLDHAIFANLFTKVVATDTCKYTLDKHSMKYL